MAIRAPDGANQVLVIDSIHSISIRFRHKTHIAKEACTNTQENIKPGSEILISCENGYVP